MNKGFSSLDPSSGKGKSNTWLTPLSLIHQLGDFDLDPCGFPGHETAKKIICLPDDGLKTEWEGRVWLNPPYGRDVGQWLLKLESHGNGIAIVFARTDTHWFQMLKPTAIFFLQGRIQFINPDSTIQSHNAGHGSCLLIYGKENYKAVLNSHLKGKMLHAKN